MPTLDGSWSPTIRQIGELERGDHWYLTPEHQCYFFGEYTARAGYSHSSTNQIIANVKKKPGVRGTPQWQYKLRDMKRVSAAIAGAINPEAWPRVTFVPIPPSKLRGDPEHDPRMAQIGRWISPQANVRELIVSRENRAPMHESDQRLRPDELLALLCLDEAQCAPTPQEILLIDDVITTGCSFVACRSMLQERFPGVPIAGIFAARRVVDHAACFGNLEDFGDL